MFSDRPSDVNNMTQQTHITEEAIETLARSIFKEASQYGFSQLDYVRFVNALLDHSMQNSSDLEVSSRERSEYVSENDRLLRELSPVELPLEGERLVIRRFQKDVDGLILKRWLDDDFGRYFLLSCTMARPGTYEEIVESESSILGTIADRDGTPIGLIAFLDYNPEQQKAELRKLIGEPSMRGKGLGKEATRLWIRYGLTTLGLAKICVSTLETNIRNIRLNEDLGFKIEGILKNEILFDGARHDVLRMGLCRD